MNTTVRFALAAVLCVAVVGCKRAAQPDPTPPPPAPERPVEVAPAPVSDRWGPEDLDRVDCLRQRVLLFDFDRYEIRPEFRQMVECHARYLRDRPSARITLEGHTDERGSREYNMGLGERRARSVGDALRGLGGSPGQITEISFGEERPVCTESNESCWQRNRRVEIIYTAR